MVELAKTDLLTVLEDVIVLLPASHSETKSVRPCVAAFRMMTSHLAVVALPCALRNTTGAGLDV
jgi:hypothetical protein